ncbi:pseudouridylate synthase [Wenzhouxiangella sp. AB-CW3]|uniref:pseudouridine synthase n=1 Tax=Wenzhouxiangella sp. AB-CW3 TaxID=2771012 RepID=UPI00168BCA18|nr:pseudouridine synthase [Wenzhouxiangella sp. AB-CW3]QOC23551.1 pseudouridylate synthase [Wenzhouxiangella sp. AB-CW3]
MTVSLESSPRFRIVYQDQWLCAIDKPCDLMVHQSKLGTDRQFAVQLLRDQIGQKVWPVHRLDRATSGVLLFALDRETASAVGRQFMAQSVDKRYLAVVRGWVDAAGEIDHPLKKHKTAAEGQPSQTGYRRLAKAELPFPMGEHDTVRYSLVEAVPKSGRRHQIRRHFKHISHHLIGDTTYGDGRHNRLFRQHLGCHRLLLHAASLELRHPYECRDIRLAASLNDKFTEVVDRVFGQIDASRAP